MYKSEQRHFCFAGLSYLGCLAYLTGSLSIVARKLPFTHNSRKMLGQHAKEIADLYTVLCIFSIIDQGKPGFIQNQVFHHSKLSALTSVAWHACPANIVHKVRSGSLVWHTVSPKLGNYIWHILYSSFWLLLSLKPSVRAPVLLWPSDLTLYFIVVFSLPGQLSVLILNTRSWGKQLQFVKKWNGFSACNSALVICISHLDMT